MTKKVLVTFPDGMWKTIKKEVMPQLGYGDADVVRAVMTAYLEDKGYLLKSKSKPSIAANEIMVASLAQLLQEKGIINFEEWEQRVTAQVS